MRLSSCTASTRLHRVVAQVFLGGRLFLRRGGGVGFGVLAPVIQGRGAVLEADHQLLATFAVLFGDEVLTRQDEHAVLAFGFLDVAVLALGGIRQAEVHAHGIVGAGLQGKGVVAQVFAGLDVVLVLVGPVQLDLFALVGNRVDAGLVDALGEKVALVVVAAEELVEMVVDFLLQAGDVHALLGNLLAQLLHLGGGFGVHAQAMGLLDGLLYFFFQLGLVGGLVLAEGVLHLGQQVRSRNWLISSARACMMR